jgi:hypothetical protein
MSGVGFRSNLEAPSPVAPTESISQPRPDL